MSRQTEAVVARRLCEQLGGRENLHARERNCKNCNKRGAGISPRRGLLRESSADPRSSPALRHEPKSNENIPPPLVLGVCIRNLQPAGIRETMFLPFLRNADPVDFGPEFEVLE